jgi:hypothetical protein
MLQNNTEVIYRGNFNSTTSRVKNYCGILFLKSGANVIKLFTAVIYLHSTVIPSLCVIKLCYLGNYCGMAINFHGTLTLEKVGLELLR